jgi:hypothetical protein
MFFAYCDANLHLFSELNGNDDVLVHLQTSSDPAELVLEMIQNPILRRDKGIVIDKGHICMLAQLMRISPRPLIKPHVKEMAIKLALQLKATETGIEENSLVILAFLLLLFNYRLISRFNNFDKDQVLNLFEYAAHHKEAVDLFRIVGFVDKISGMFVKDVLFLAIRHICVCARTNVFVF